ncbi:hypothetical protein BC938DRAFT_473402 [Jimgerdemannia flammicorona]|uniref:Uncharacterized protein n=1 Tax=Jimgerdemannia flammicorona TaxID=994334 RepID=A0A433Q455_9FUNG|nr:hypothetical protein BC938DRAFT_473402 [Jimgerdemannia flammicorona]
MMSVHQLVLTKRVQGATRNPTFQFGHGSPELLVHYFGLGGTKAELILKKALTIRPNKCFGGHGITGHARCIEALNSSMHTGLQLRDEKQWISGAGYIFTKPLTSRDMDAHNLSIDYGLGLLGSGLPGSDDMGKGAGEAAEEDEDENLGDGGKEEVEQDAVVGEQCTASDEEPEVTAVRHGEHVVTVDEAEGCEVAQGEDKVDTQDDVDGRIDEAYDRGVVIEDGVEAVADAEAYGDHGQDAVEGCNDAAGEEEVGGFGVVALGRRRMDGAHADLDDPGAEGEEGGDEDHANAHGVEDVSGRNEGLGGHFVVINALDC